MSENTPPTATDPPREVAAVRIRLGADRPAPQPDPLGRQRVGYADGASGYELWERGRGVWKAKLPNVSAADLALLVHEDRVVGVGSVDGVTFHDDRIAISGIPLLRHPLIGQPDPLPNKSRNPIAYGTVRTVPSAAYRSAAQSVQRPYEDVLADAVRVMTEAARLRRAVYQPASTGSGYEVHPTETEPADWAEFVCLALAGAAANVGGIEAALQGRPGSWEASRVRDLLASQIGDEDETLLQYRTEPLRIVLTSDPDLDWLEELYEESYEIFNQKAEEAAGEYSIDAHTWTFGNVHNDGRSARDTDRAWTGTPITGEFVCEDPDAPSYEEAVARFKDDLRAQGAPESVIAMMPNELTISFPVSKTDEDRAELVRLRHLADQVAAPYEDVIEAMGQQHDREIAEYNERLHDTIRREAVRRFPNVPLEIRVVSAGEWLTQHAEFDSIEDQLIEHAKEHTPLPGSVLAPVDYPSADSIAILETERAAGRLPHLRLPRELP